MNDPNPYERLREALKRLEIARAKPFLVLGWRRSTGKVVGGKYPITDDMAPLLRNVAADAKGRVSTAHMPGAVNGGRRGNLPVRITSAPPLQASQECGSSSLVTYGADV